MKGLVPLVLAVGAVAACKGSPMPARSAAPPKSPPSADPLDALLESHCGGCHDGKTQKPAFGKSVRGDRALAMRMAMRIAAEEMPPPPDSLPADVQSTLIAALCQVGAPNPELCVETITPRDVGLPSLATPELVRAIATVAPKVAEPEVEERIKDAIIKDEVERDKTRPVRLDTTAEGIKVVLAVSRCRPKAADGGAFKQCVAQILDPELGTPPRVPGREGH